MRPTASVGALGVTVTETSAGAVTISDVDPEMPASVAVMTVLPSESVVARPVGAIVAADVVADIHVTLLVRSRVEWSVYVPVAANCCVTPDARVG